MDGSVIIKAVLDTVDVRKNMSGLKSELKGITWSDLTQGTEKAMALGRSFQTAGTSLSLAVTAPLVLAGKTAFDAAVEFESSFAGVRKTVSATEEEFDALADASRRMSETKPISANDVNRIMELGGQLGIATDNLEDFAGVIADLDVSTDLGIEQGATQMAQYANITGMTQDKFRNFGSTIVALGNTTATTESAIMNMAHRIAGAGSQIGLTDDQILALSASLSSVGIEAEAGGTAISTVMSQIDKDVARNSDSVQTWADVAGMSASEFAAAWEGDPVTALQALFSGMDEASQSGENMNLILDELGISSLRQTDMMKRLSGASDILASSVDTASTAWEENNALTNEAEQRYSTTESQMQIFNNKMENIAATIGGPLMEAFNAALDALTPFFDIIKGLAEAFAEAPQPIQLLVIGLVGLVAAAGPILLVVGSIIQILPVLSAAVGVVTGAFGALNLTLLANPIVWIIGLIVAFIAALVYLYDTNEEFRAAVDAAWNGIMEIIQTVMDIIVPIIQAAWDAIWGIISPVLDMILNIVGSVFGAIFNVIGSVMSAIAGVIQGAWQVVQGIFETVLGFLVGIVTGDFSMMQSGISNIMGGIANIVSSIWNGIAGALSGILNGIAGTFESVLNGITGTVSGIFGGIADIIGGIIGDAENIVSNGLNAIAGFFSGLRIEFPHINLPHFSISGEFSLAPPSIPTIGIDWYAKGGVFNGASVIGVGEAGPEAVVPLSGQNMQPFAEAIASNMGGKRDTPTTITVTVRIDRFINNTADDVKTISKRMADETETELKARGIIQ